MSGVLVVRAETPSLKRAGVLGVFVDDVKVGEVKQGEVARFTVEPGAHVVRTQGRASRSNTVAVEVREGAVFVVTAYSTGYSMLTAVLPALGLLAMIPGLVIRVRAEGDDVVPRRQDDEDAPDSGGGSAAPWWESDPQLAKRYRKSTAS